MNKYKAEASQDAYPCVSGLDSQTIFSTKDQGKSKCCFFAVARSSIHSEAKSCCEAFSTYVPMYVYIYVYLQNLSLFSASHLASFNEKQNTFPPPITTEVCPLRPSNKQPLVTTHVAFENGALCCATWPPIIKGNVATPFLNATIP